MRFIEKIVYFRPSFTVRIVAGILALVLMVAACTLVGISDSVRGLSERETIYNTARKIEQGANVYFQYCARCHGPDGKGIEGAGPAIASEALVGRIDNEGNIVKASDRLKEIGWQGTVRSYVAAVTASGIPLKNPVWDAPHPTFSNLYGGPLRPDEIENVALFVQNYGLDPSTSGNIDPPKPGEGGAARPTAVPLTAEQQAGLQVYLKTGCNACHAIRGAGSQGAIGPNLNKIGSEAGKIITDPQFKYTGQAKTGADYINESIVNPNVYIYPQCPQGPCQAGLMPQTYGQQLRPEEINQLVAYLLTLR